MKKFLKITVIIYFALVFPILFFIADFFILDSNPKIYSLIPQDADIVIEINTKNFIQEVAYQRIFNETYFKQKLPQDEEESLVNQDNMNIGIDIYSQVIFFRENWAEHNVWYAVISINDKSNFETYLTDNDYEFNIEYADNYAIILLTPDNNQELLTHQKNIASYKVKSFDSKIDLSEVFSAKNELNVYLSPKDSKDIIDGYLHFNFEKDRVITKGSFTPIGKIEDIPFVKYQTNDDKAVTLRSSLNLFNSVYLFNKNVSLKNLPQYTQLCLDFDGTILKTSHSEIPIVAYPKLNIQFDIKDSLMWDSYLTELNDTNTFFIDKTNHKFIINSESKSIFNYELSENYFKIYQVPTNFNNSELANTYFYLNIHPNSILENTEFIPDTLNPPTLMDGIKIGIIESLMDDMNFFSDVDVINFTITTNENTTDFTSQGKVIYLEKNGHSMVESIALAQKFFGSVGAFLD